MKTTVPALWILLTVSVAFLITDVAATVIGIDSPTTAQSISRSPDQLIVTHSIYGVDSGDRLTIPPAWDINVAGRAVDHTSLYVALPGTAIVLAPGDVPTTEAAWHGASIMTTHHVELATASIARSSDGTKPVLEVIWHFQRGNLDAAIFDSWATSIEQDAQDDDRIFMFSDLRYYAADGTVLALQPWLLMASGLTALAALVILAVKRPAISFLRPGILILMALLGLGAVIALHEIAQGELVPHPPFPEWYNAISLLLALLVAAAIWMTILAREAPQDAV